MTREQRIEQAEALRGEGGFTYREIGEWLGVSTGTVWGWCNPEARHAIDKRVNAKRGPAKRKWEDEQRAECPECGQLMQAGSALPSRKVKRCAECVRDEVDARLHRFIRLRKEGLTNVEIGRREGLSAHAVASALYSARGNGWSVPPSPYWSRGAA